MDAVPDEVVVKFGSIYRFHNDMGLMGGFRVYLDDGCAHRMEKVPPLIAPWLRTDAFRIV